MSLNLQIIWLFILPISIACISWTVTHEEIFKVPRDYCSKKSKSAKAFIERKFFYVFTCEYCFSHYITILFLFLTDFKLLLLNWKGYVIAGFALVWIANLYMSLFGFIRQDIKKVKREIENIEKEP